MRKGLNFHTKTEDSQVRFTLSSEDGQSLGVLLTPSEARKIGIQFLNAASYADGLIWGLDSNGKMVYTAK